YDGDTLEALLEHYLEHAEERQRITAAAREKAARFTFSALWDETLDRIDKVWPALSERSRHRPALSKTDGLAARLWQAYHAPARSDADLLHDLDTALATEPNSAALANATGLALARAHPHQRTEKAVAAAAADRFEQAVALSPSHLIARLNWAEALST